MHCLQKSSQTQTRLNLLLALSKIKSENIKNALSDYLVRGINKTAAAALNNVPAPNLTKALQTLSEKAETVEKIKEHDWVNH